MSRRQSNIMQDARNYPAIRSNIAYSILLTGVTYLFPLVVYPYVSRVLGVEGVGLVGFIDSLVTYFILFSMMGISILGVRETARHRDNPRELTRAFGSLLSLNMLMTGVCLIALTVVTLCVERLRADWMLMTIGGFKLISNTFLVEWFFRGLEDFRYITWRSVIIRGSYVIAVFLLVDSRDDLLIYYALTMFVVFATSGVNMVCADRLLGYSMRLASPRRYVRPFFSLGVYELLGATYTTLNVVVLGFVTDDTEVGYYSTAAKLFGILLALYTALGMAVMPRITAMVTSGEMSRLRGFRRRCLSGMLAFAVPLSIAGVIWAPELVLLLSGPGFAGAVVPVRIIFSFFTVFGLSRYLVVCVLTPGGRERVINRASWMAAGLALLLNILVVPRFGAVGSAIVWVSSETLLLISLLIQSKDRRKE